MNKKLKGKFTEWETSLYNLEWVEKAADDGYEEFLGIFNGSLKGTNRISKDNYHFAMIYYAAFEHALNVFIQQVLEDGITSITLNLNELCKVTAAINERT